MTSWQDGDEYSVQVGLPTAMPLIQVSRPVTYVRSHPNGPSCPPICLSASLN
jgi:hypothetical protein